MKQLIVVTSNKGGIGKSFASKLIYQTYQEQVAPVTGLSILGLDVDADNNSFSNSYGSDILKCDYSKDAGRKALASIPVSHPESDVVLMDFMGGNLGNLKNLSGYVFDEGEEENDFINFYIQHDYKIKVVIPMDDSPDSLIALRAVHQFFGLQVDYFILRIMKEEKDIRNAPKYFKNFKEDVSFGDFKPYNYVRDVMKLNPESERSIVLTGLEKPAFDRLGQLPFDKATTNRVFSDDVFTSGMVYKYFKSAQKKVINSGLFE